MSRSLRFLALLIFLSGSFSGVFFTRALLGDEPYYRARLALSRHPGHLLYQADYQVARVRHTGLLFAAVGSGLAAIVLPALLLPLAEILDQTRTARLAARLPDKLE